MRFLIFITALLFIMAALTIGGLQYDAGISQENFTKHLDEIAWPGINETGVGIEGIIYKFADFVGYTGIEIVKIGADLGYKNPQYDYPYMLENGVRLFKIAIIAVILFALIPVIVPLIALITILVMGIKGLFKKKGEKKKK